MYWLIILSFFFLDQGNHFNYLSIPDCSLFNQTGGFEFKFPF